MHPRTEPANAVSISIDEHDLCVPVWSEYREMPGLNLTLGQAARLPPEGVNLEKFGLRA